MSSPLAPLRRALASTALARTTQPATDAAVDELAQKVRVPELARGDLALPCFDLARRAGRNPVELAREVAEALKADARFASAEAAGPFVNVRLTPAALAEAVVPAARAATYGAGREGQGRTVVVDFSSPNIAKPLAFHHIRSTVIGAAVGRIHAARGWRVVGINYLGDWGKQFGLLATGFRRYGDPARRADAKHLVEVYVRANRDADVKSREEAVALADEAQRAVNELTTLRAQGPAAGDKARADRQAALEKRLRALRGMADKKADPLAASDAWLADVARHARIAHEELPAARERDQEARLYLKRMEEGDADALREWREYRETSIADFERIYARMGVSFTSIEGESRYSSVLEETIARVRARPGVRESEGALLVDFAYKPGEAPVLLKTRDGTTLYVTRDLAAAADRQARFGFDRALYVVAHDQSLHFEQLARTLGAMGYAWSERVVHVPFGRVHGMSTRRGEVVFLDEVLDEAVDKAREICRASERIDQSRLEETTEAVGVGAVIFGDLKNQRQNDYHFRLDEVLNFEGLTGPYAQYTHARAASVVRKHGAEVPARADYALLDAPEERAVLLALAAFPDAVRDACEAFEPSLVARSVLDVAQAMSQYLTAGKRDRGLRVLLEGDDARRAARLHLVQAVQNTLARGLGLLGVRAPDVM